MLAYFPLLVGDHQLHGQGQAGHTRVRLPAGERKTRSRMLPSQGAGAQLPGPPGPSTPLPCGWSSSDPGARRQRLNGWVCLPSWGLLQKNRI